MFKYSCLVLVAALFVVSCGKSKTALTPEQKQEFAAVVESQGRVNSAAKKVTESTRSRNSRGSEVQPGVQTEQILVQRLSSADCIPQMTEMKGFDDGQMDLTKPITFGYSVKGDRCPVTFNFAMTMQMSQTSMNMSLDLSFLIKDEELKKLNDVFGLTLKGEMKGSGKSAGGELKGSISSQKHGEIPTSISLSGNENGGEVVWNFELPKNPVEVKFVVSGDARNPKVEYYLNGEAISKQEFEQQFKNKGGEMFAFSPQQSEQETVSSSPSSETPTTPVFPTPTPLPGGWWIGSR